MSLLSKYLWNSIFENEEHTLSAAEKSEVEQYNEQQKKSLHYTLRNQADELLKPFNPEKDKDGKYSEYAKAMNDYDEKAKAFTEISKEIEEIEIRKLKALAKEFGINNVPDSTNKEAWAKFKAEVNAKKKDNKEKFEEISKQFNNLIDAKKDEKDKLKQEQDKAADKKKLWDDLKKKVQDRANKIKAIADKIKANEAKIKAAREKMERARAKIKALEQQQAQREESEKAAMDSLSSGLKSLLDSTKESYEQEIESKKAEIEEKKRQAELDIKEEADAKKREQIENAVNKEVKAIEDKQKEIENFQKKIGDSNKELSNEIDLNKELKQAAKAIEDKAKARKDHEAKAAKYNGKEGTADKPGDPRITSKKKLDNLNAAQNEYTESLRAILMVEFPDENIDNNTSLERLIEISDSKKSKIAKNVVKNIKDNKKSIADAETEYGKACYEAKEFGIAINEEQRTVADKYEDSFSIDKFLKSKKDKTTKVETNDSGEEITKYTPIQVTVGGEQIQICYIDGKWIKMNKNQEKNYEPTDVEINPDDIKDWKEKLKVDVPVELTDSEKDAYKSLTGKDIDGYPENINEPYGEDSRLAKSQAKIDEERGKVTKSVNDYNEAVTNKDNQIKIPSGFENDTKQENDLEDPSNLDSFDKLKSFFDSELTEEEKKGIKEKLGKEEDDELTEEDKDKLKQELQNWYSNSTEETEDDGSDDPSDLDSFDELKDFFDRKLTKEQKKDIKEKLGKSEDDELTEEDKDKLKQELQNWYSNSTEEPDDDEDYVEKTNRDDDDTDDESKDENDADGKPKPPKRTLKRKTRIIRLKGGGRRKSKSIIGYNDDGIIKDDNGKAVIFSKEDLRKNKDAWKRYKTRMIDWKEEHPDESLSIFLQNNLNIINENKSNKLSEYLNKTITK